MLQNQVPSADSNPPKFHRLFKLYDPEVVAVLIILLGLFQLLLTLPTYSVTMEMRYMFVCPLCVGVVSVIAGSFGIASERNPSQALLRNSLYAGLAALVGTVIALFLYGYATSKSKTVQDCQVDFYQECPDQMFKAFYDTITRLLLFYNSTTLLLLCFLACSAVKGLKMF